MTALALNSLMQGVAVGSFWVPLTVATFPTLDSRRMPEAMALFHLMRNIGSSFFISVCVAEIIRCVVCLKTGQWPDRLKDAEEIDVIEQQLSKSEYVDEEARMAAIAKAKDIDEAARQRAAGGQS